MVRGTQFVQRLTRFVGTNPQTDIMLVSLV